MDGNSMGNVVLHTESSAPGAVQWFVWATRKDASRGGLSKGYVT